MTLTATQPIHKRSRFLLSLKGFLQKSVQSSNLCFAPQNRHFVKPFGPGSFDLLELVGSDLPLPPLLAYVERELPFSLSGFGFGFPLNLGLLDAARPSNSGMFAFSRPVQKDLEWCSLLLIPCLTCLRTPLRHWHPWVLS